MSKFSPGYLKTRRGSCMRDEVAIQTRLDELAVLNALYESITVVDADTWKRREEVSQQYLAVTDWLYAHGVFPQYDSEHSRFIGKRFPAEGGEQDESVKREQNMRTRRAVPEALTERPSARGWPYKTCQPHGSASGIRLVGPAPCGWPFNSRLWGAALLVLASLLCLMLAQRRGARGWLSRSRPLQ